MNKRKIPTELLSYIDLVKGLGEILGSDCEILLHDVSNPEHSIIACANAQVSGRGVGSPMTDFGLRMLKDPKYQKMTGVYNYQARTGDGRLLKCGVCFIRDAAGRIVGFLCINMDVTKIAAAREALDEFFVWTPQGMPRRITANTSRRRSATSSPTRLRRLKRSGAVTYPRCRAQTRSRWWPASTRWGFPRQGGDGTPLRRDEKSKFTLYAYLRSVHSPE